MHSSLALRAGRAKGHLQSANLLANLLPTASDHLFHQPPPPPTPTPRPHHHPTKETHPERKLGLKGRPPRVFNITWLLYNAGSGGATGLSPVVRRPFLLCFHLWTSLQLQCRTTTAAAAERQKRQIYRSYGRRMIVQNVRSASQHTECTPRRGYSSSWWLRSTQTLTRTKKNISPGDVIQLRRVIPPSCPKSTRLYEPVRYHSKPSRTEICVNATPCFY